MNKIYSTPEVKVKSCLAGSFFAISAWDEPADPNEGALSKWGDLWEEDNSNSVETTDAEKRHIYRY